MLPLLLLNLFLVSVTAQAPGPVQPGQPSSCDRWYLAQQGDTCQLIAGEYALSVNQFLQWNPAINNQCTSGLLADYAYCVGIVSGSYPYAPGPTLPGEPSDCDRWYVVQPGDTCPSIAYSNDISLSQFLSWNPSLNPSCTRGLYAGYAYCVAITYSAPPPPITPPPAYPPGPVQPGQPSNCDRWYLARSGDTCEIVAESQGITYGELLEWNPAINSDCTAGFIAGYAYCIGVN